MQNKSSESKTTRRKALQVIGAGVVTTGFFACTEGGGDSHGGGEKKKAGGGHGEDKMAKKTEKTAAPDKPGSKPGSEPSKADKAAGGGGELSCNEGIDEQSKTMRKTLQYVEKTPKEGKNCANCMQWKKPEGDSKCGGCTLFAGQVNPNGYCLSYAPKAA